MVGKTFSSSGLGKIVGFFGRAGSFIDQVGVYSKSIEKLTIKSEGPWGGDGGNDFMDECGEIVEISVTYDSNQIVSLRSTYNRQGTFITCDSHGGKSGSECIKVDLMLEPWNC